MKIRTAFVSNSSTSSFICEICGEEAIGMDISLADYEMFQCENGHTLCNEHATKDLTCNGKTEEEQGDGEEWYESEIDETCCPICAYQEISYRDARSFLKKEYKVSEKEVFDEIKKVNKRRKKLYDEEYVKEVFEREGLNDDTFLEMIKKRFPSYKDYRSYKQK